MPCSYNCSKRWQNITERSWAHALITIWNIATLLKYTITCHRQPSGKETTTTVLCLPACQSRHAKYKKKQTTFMTLYCAFLDTLPAAPNWHFASFYCVCPVPTQMNVSYSTFGLWQCCYCMVHIKHPGCHNLLKTAFFPYAQGRYMKVESKALRKKRRKRLLAKK